MRIIPAQLQFWIHWSNTLKKVQRPLIELFPDGVEHRQLLRSDISPEYSVYVLHEVLVLVDNTTKYQRLYACCCAEYALNDEREKGREPNPRLWKSIKVARRYAFGNATIAELKKEYRYAENLYDKLSNAPELDPNIVIIREAIAAVQCATDSDLDLHAPAAAHASILFRGDREKRLRWQTEQLCDLIDQAEGENQ